MFIHCYQYQFSVCGNDAHTQKFKTLKSSFNTFQTVDKAFSFSYSLKLYFVHSKQRTLERKY